jgi:hypothetical protein
VIISRVITEQDASDNADILVSAYSMAKASVMRSTPASLFDRLGVDVYLARIGADTVGSVTLTYHGETCGIWAMGADVNRQRGDIGRPVIDRSL